jgi:hypothetical protein
MESSSTSLPNKLNLTHSIQCNKYLISIVSQSLTSVWLSRCICFLLIVFTFIGLIKLLEIILISVEQITNHKIWNKTLANLTLITFSLNLFEVLYPTIELINGFQSTGPNLIIVFNFNYN